jgi:predicted nucleic acid-binding Zn ribbon protein
VKYLYECKNENCKCYEIPVEITKPMSESSKEEVCEYCREIMQRVFTSPGVKTSDGYKS